jgi:hypothetical protein
LRRGMGHVIQYGNVDGIRTGVWQDPPIYAAEFDVTTWPPTRVRAPTELTSSMHTPADLVELPNGKLGLTFWFDNDGNGPSGVRYRTLDAATWALDPEGFLLPSGAGWTRPVLTADKTGFFSTYELTVPSPSDFRFAARLGVFGFDGAPKGAPLTLWEKEGLPFTAVRPELASAARFGGDVVVAAAFTSCENGGAYCEARSIVLLRATASGFEKIAAIAVVDPTREPKVPLLVSDDGDHRWLLWSEMDVPPDGGSSTVRAVYAVPLAQSGAPAGPVERWDTDLQSAYAVDFPVREPSVGPLGLVLPLQRYPSPDGAFPHEREVHLLHRQLDVQEPVEDITFTTPFTFAATEVAQIASPRSLVVGYSTWDPTLSNGHGEMRKYVCREDLP